MQKLHFSVQINAKKEKVWDVMFGDATYKEWKGSVWEGSYYKGDWSEGSKMLFLAPHLTGPEESGWIGRVSKNRKYELMSIEDIGHVSDGVEHIISKDERKSLPSYEDYTFVDKDGGTELLIDVDFLDEYETIDGIGSLGDRKTIDGLSVRDEDKAQLERTWSKGLKAIKEIAERV